MTYPKLLILVFWAICAYCFSVDSNQSFAMLGRLFFWATAIAHLAEFAMFFGLFREAGGSMGRHFARTLAFGLFHIREVRAQIDASKS